MDCNQKTLQQFLDGELEPVAKAELIQHLSGCRRCRQELARLKLLWLELAQPEPIAIPPELPYMRQQALAGFRKQQASSMAGTAPTQPAAAKPVAVFLEKQGTAWYGAWLGAKMGVTFNPGAGLLGKLAQTIAKKAKVANLGAGTISGRSSTLIPGLGPAPGLLKAALKFWRREQKS